MTYLTALLGLVLMTGGAETLPLMTSAPSAVEASEKLALREPVAVDYSGAGAVHTVKVTAYNAVPEQTDSDPTVTASGARSNPEVIAARSKDLLEDLPFGTVIELSRSAEDTENCRFEAVSSQIGYRVIADRMHSRKVNQIDILLDENETVEVHGKQVNPALALGLCSGVDIRVVGQIDVDDIPETQEELQLIIEEGRVALL